MEFESQIVDAAETKKVFEINAQITENTEIELHEDSQAICAIDPIYYDQGCTSNYACMNEISEMTTYYPQYYVPQYNLPVLIPDWGSVATAFQPIYSSEIASIAPPVYTSIWPYTGTIVADSVIAPVINAITCVPDVDAACSYICVPEVNCIQETEDVQSFNTVEEEPEKYDVPSKSIQDPMELFLSLPKELFPTAKMQDIDPNHIIDQFCQIPSINGALNWILDLEFGLPRVPVSRSLAFYNVMSNSVYCKNTTKVHPGFDKCSTNFKQVILYYYKQVVSQWYKGYVIMNHDNSMDNFQTWLMLPTQLFGMGWR